MNVIPGMVCNSSFPTPTMSHIGSWTTSSKSCSSSSNSVCDPIQSSPDQAQADKKWGQAHSSSSPSNGFMLPHCSLSVSPGSNSIAYQQTFIVDTDYCSTIIQEFQVPFFDTKASSSSQSHGLCHLMLIQTFHNITLAEFTFILSSISEWGDFW